MPNFFINVKEKGAKKAAGNIGLVTKSMKNMAAQVAIAAGGMELFRKAIGRSAEVEGVKRGFDNLAKSLGFSAEAFDRFKEATDGTIDNLTLMKKANTAMLLGITDSEEQMADMFDVAQRLGQSLGIDTVQSIDSLVTGMGRQSKLMLDNLGIMVDTNKSYKDYAEANNIAVSAMTDTERKQAFVNAAMKEANFLVEQLGSEQLTTKDKIAQMNTALLESLTAFGNLMTPLVIPFAEALGWVAEKASAVLDVVSNVNHEFAGVSSTLPGFNKLLKENAGDEEWLKQKTEELNKEIAKQQLELEGLVDTGQKIAPNYGDMALSVDLSGGALQGMNESMIITNEQFAILSQLIVDGTLNLNDYMVSEEESTLVTINSNVTRAEAINFLIEEAKRKLALIEASKKEGEQDKATTAQKLKSMSVLTGGLSAMAGEIKGGALASKRLAQATAVIDTWAGANKALASAPPPWNFVAAAGVVAAGLANVSKIESQQFAQGGDFVTSGPQMIMVGDNVGGREHVQVTPLSSPNTEGPQGGGQTINVSVEGNVMTEDFVETELAEKISEAIRRGTDFGIS